MKIKNLFDDKIFYKGLFMIGLPIMLQNLFNSLVNMASIVMIGKLGTVEIAAVGLGNQVFFLLNMILFGICSGGGVFTAQFWGKKDIAGIRKNLGLCLTLTTLTAGLFTVVCMMAPGFIIGLYSNDPAVIACGAKYLKAVAPCFLPFAISFSFTIVMRSIEKVRLSMVTTFITISLNLLISALLIFGVGPLPAMGVVGAATATVIARIVELIILVSVSYVKKYALAGKPADLFGYNGVFVKRFFVIAFPVMINEILWSLGISMQNVIFARTNTDALAAFNITNTFSQLIWVVFIGLGNGASVLIGKKIGEGKENIAREYASRITLFAPLLAFVLSFMLFPLSRLLPVFFNVGGNVFSITGMMFILLAISYPFRAFNMSMIIGVCRAGGDTIFGIFYDISIMWLFTLPLAAAASFVFHAPAWVIYLCLCTEDPLKMTLGLWRLKSGKWLHNVT